MRALIVGATGTIGQAVANIFAEADHDVLRGSRKGEVTIDIEDPDSIQTMYSKLGKIDAVVSCAGDGAFAKLTDLSDEQLHYTLRSKVMGQINLVRYGVESLNDGGVFVLTAGILGRDPTPGVTALSMANGAVENFARAAALDLPRDIRIGAFSPPFITETALKMGMSADGTLSAADNARAYLAFLEGSDTGVVVFPGD